MNVLVPFPTPSEAENSSAAETQRERLITACQAGRLPGGERAAATYSLIESAKLNELDPRAWLADILARLPDHPARRIDDLLPWNWRPRINADAQAA